MKTTLTTGGDTPTPSQTPLSAGAVPWLPEPDEIDALIVWRGDPNDPYFDRLEFARAVWSKAWTHAIVTAKLDDRAIITAQAAEIERLKRELAATLHIAELFPYCR